MESAFNESVLRALVSTNKKGEVELPRECVVEVGVFMNNLQSLERMGFLERAGNGSSEFTFRLTEKGEVLKKLLQKANVSAA